MADVEPPLVRERLAFGPFMLSPTERLLTRDGEPVEIGGRSFDLLVVLTEQPGRVLSKRELLKRVWFDVVVEDGSLRFHMAGLRKLLGDGTEGARYIATQVGVGYAFVAQIERHSVHDASPSPATLMAEDLSPVSVSTAINLPARLTRLIGRDADLELLEKRVVDTQLFTIVGSAGVGKTSLAIDVGHRLATAFMGRVAFVDFAMLENPALVPSMIAGAMGIPVHSDDPLAVILGHVRDDAFLLILDNCEHVVEPAAKLVERIMEDALQVRILSTSREPLRVRGENVHRLDALAYPEDPAGLQRDEILTFPAVQLFCERASAADSSLEIDDEAAILIAEMCGRLDGMALPIELAAVRVATHGIAATAAQLGERFSLAWAGRRTAMPRHQTLQATLDWSYDLLTDVERRVLERLSVFVGPFSIDAALEVVADEHIGADEVAFAVDELVSKSLVAPDRARATGTYRLLEMTRAYAKQKLFARGADLFNGAARRHAGFFLSELEAVAAQEEDLLQDQRPLRQQLGNIRSALDWSFGRDGDHRIAVRLAAASAAVFLNLSHLIECRTWCARALAEIEDGQLGTAIELELQAALGISLMFTRGNSDSAGRALRRALEVAADLEDRWNQLRILGRLHIFHERIGEYDAAMGHARRAVEIAEAIGNDEALGVAYSLSGISHHLAGDQQTARRDLELSLSKSPRSIRSRTIHFGFDHRNRSGIALARTLWLTGEADRATQVASQTVATAAKLNHPVTHCIALIWSLAVHTWMEDLDTADVTLSAFTECAEVNALGPYIAAAAGLKGELSILRGRTEDALGAVEESLSRLRSARYELLTTPFSIALARGLLLEGREREAGELLDGAIARCESNGERFAMPELLRIKANVRGSLGDDAGAIELLQTAIDLAGEQGALAWQIRSAVDMAILERTVGKPAGAATLLAGLLAKGADGNETAEVQRARELVGSLPQQSAAVG
ncbi:winged helix-turn-helix domain-containing protein [Novosphingobium sp. P6W]|uniref:ATP-binding protein n=1 Tax=Novosphingobium sp. P6W TaxID=1609758 RepID=UPI0005C5ECA2|nr:winged helix-turn-helix domain-containing protein [Novosphingobium sp. P6W]AXB78920.1 transcriptional regulator [Novosphingobium sp. P6W]